MQLRVATYFEGGDCCKLEHVLYCEIVTMLLFQNTYNLEIKIFIVDWS